MTRDEILLDLYTRLTSRKFVSFLISVLFLIWNFYSGRIDALTFQVLFASSAAAYGLVEGVSDFGANLKSSPENVTRVDASTTVTDTATKTATAKRVRPSRAKKVAGK